MLKYTNTPYTMNVKKLFSTGVIIAILFITCEDILAQTYVCPGSTNSYRLDNLTCPGNDGCDGYTVTGGTSTYTGSQATGGTIVVTWDNTQYGSIEWYDNGVIYDRQEVTKRTGKVTGYSSYEQATMNSTYGNLKVNTAYVFWPSTSGSPTPNVSWSVITQDETFSFMPTGPPGSSTTDIFTPSHYSIFLADDLSEGNSITIRCSYNNGCTSGHIDQLFSLILDHPTASNHSIIPPICNGSRDAKLAITSITIDDVVYSGTDNIPENLRITVVTDDPAEVEINHVTVTTSDQFPIVIEAGTDSEGNKIPFGPNEGVSYKYYIERYFGNVVPNGFAHENTFSINEDGPNLILKNSIQEPLCYNGSLTNVEVTLNSTNEFNYYDKTNGQSLGTNSLGSFTYNLSNSDNYNLHAISTANENCISNTLNFINPSQKTLSLGSEKPTCSGGADGKIIIASTTNYNNSTYSGTFRVYPNETSNTPTETIDVTGITLSGDTLPQGFEAGDYYLSFYDGTCESERAFINIANQTNTEIKITQTNSSNITNCYYPNGKLQVSATGGNTDLTYSLYGQNANIPIATQDNGDFDITDIGNYYVVVSDGCNTTDTSSTKSITRVLPEITSTDTTQTHATCYHGPATITINNFSYGGQSAADAGLENFTLQFRSPGNSDDITNYTLPFNYAAAGGQDWDITILHETSGCGNTIDFPAIGQPAQVSLSVLNIDSVRCYDHSNGSIEVVANEGNTNANRIYTISPDPNNIGGLSTTIEGESIIFNNLPTGTYSITVDDGCPDFNTDEETSIVVNNYPEIQANLSSNQMSCHDIEDGEILVSSSGGIGQLSFSLNGSGEIPGTTTDNITYTNAFGGLNDYTAYSVTIKDVNGCDSTYQADPINNPPPLEITVTDTTEVTCFGGNNGQIYVEAIGGTGDIRFSTDSITFVSDIPADNNYNFTGLTEGNHTIYLLDDNDCPLSNPLTVSLNTITLI